MFLYKNQFHVDILSTVIILLKYFTALSNKRY